MAENPSRPSYSMPAGLAPGAVVAGYQIENQMVPRLNRS